MIVAIVYTSHSIKYEVLGSEYLYLVFLWCVLRMCGVWWGNQGILGVGNRHDTVT